MFNDKKMNEREIMVAAQYLSNWWVSNMPKFKGDKLSKTQKESIEKELRKLMVNELKLKGQLSIYNKFNAEAILSQALEKAGVKDKVGVFTYDCLTEVKDKVISISYSDLYSSKTIKEKRDIKDFL